MPEEQVVQTATGLEYVEILEGTGAQPKAGDSVSVHYAGWLKSGQKFDTAARSDLELEEEPIASVPSHRALRPRRLGQELFDLGGETRIRRVFGRWEAVRLDGVRAQELGPLAREEARRVEEIEAGEGSARKDSRPVRA